MKCKFCGEEFVSDHPSRKFCSDSCRVAYNREYQRKYRIKKQIEQRDLSKQRMKRREQDKERRIQAAIQICEEMGLRGSRDA